MAYRQDWIKLIRALAPKYGLDPQALLAVASREGLSGGVGDGGHAFGPFQLNDAGGVITSRAGNHRAFAESPQGIAWALSQIAQVARGQHGAQAVNSIVSRFERPADPRGEIAGATAALNQFAPGQGGGVTTTTTSAPASPGASPDIRATLARQLAAGGNVDLLSLALAAAGRAGSGQAPGRSPGPSAMPSGGGSPLVSAAASQLGQPYVWGGESRKEGGFDCSGLIDYAMRQQGYTGPRITTQTIAGMGVSVKGKALQPGDLVLTNGGDHVVIYAGNGRVIAAPHSGTVVQYQPLSRFRVTDVRRVAAGHR